MQLRVASSKFFAVSVLTLFSASAFSEPRSAHTEHFSPPAAKRTSNLEATTPASDALATEQAIRFLEARVTGDPEDFSAQNTLAGYYLRRLRETSNLGFLEQAAAAARASLAALPAEGNPGGLAALAMCEHAAHDFAAARDHAVRLTEVEPSESYPYEILGDALLELGDYEKAEAAFRKVKQLEFASSVNSETRLARLAVLHGKTHIAKQHFSNALALALDSQLPAREAVAWCHWQLGETAFSIGDYKTAEHHYRHALTTFPDYPQALASLGLVRAAQDDLSGAIEFYRHAAQISPDPALFAALGDLYKLAGQEKNAQAQYQLVGQIGRLGELNGATYNRQLAMFYADHDLKADEAYKDAIEEYAVRRDIYGADAVAWTALKANKLNEAQAAIKQALRLGTRDAKLFYHAGMIARAAGDRSRAHDYLERALKLNPQFDPLQSSIAKGVFARLAANEHHTVSEHSH